MTFEHMVPFNNPVKENFGLSHSKFLREPIEDQGQMLQVAARSAREKGYIHFIAFWGVSPLKKTSDAIDNKAMAFMNLIIAQIGYELVTPVRLTLLFGDTHACANLIPDTHAEGYRKSVCRFAKTYGFDVVPLSSFFHSDGGLTDPYLPEPQHLEAYSSNSKSLLEAALNTGPAESAIDRALRYVTIRLKEKDLMRAHFSDSILLANDRPRNKYLLPDLPSIFTYSTGSKESKKAWFTSQPI